MIRNLHVNHENGEWVIKFGGDRNPISTAKTQEQAITCARRIAENERCELIVHDEKGKVQSLHK